MTSPKLLLIPAILLFSFGCRRGAEDSGPPPERVHRVQSATVKMKKYADEVEALGTVKAWEAIDLSANVTESVVDVFFEDGQAVKKDDVLAELSSSEEQALLAAAEVNLAEQEREVNRLRELAEDGAVSQVRLQEYLTQRDLALQQIEEAKARLADRRIVAPFDGILGFRRISPGALVTPGDVITTLDLIDRVKLDFSVPETFLSDLGPGLEITAFSTSYPNESFAGTVTDVDSRVNPITRSVIVRAEIPNPEHRLRPGMLMTTRLKRNPTESTSIPERALVSVQSRHFVFLIEGEAETTVKRVEVTLGRRVPGYLEIKEGLEVGQRIVSDGTINLRDGATVEVTGEFTEPSDAYRPNPNS